MKSVGFETIHGKKVFYCLNKLDKKQIVIMCHGFRGSSIGPARAFVDFEHILEKDRISSLRFDQPNGGNSEGDYINSSFNEWIETIAFFTKKYLKEKYQVILLGQSMGATAVMTAVVKKKLQQYVPCVLLWVPDPKLELNIDINKTYEENGQLYKGRFWLEAQENDFMSCFNNYVGQVHLVYGEHDKYISAKTREMVMTKAKSKDYPVMILPGQDHSPWEQQFAQQVFAEQLAFIKVALNIE